MANLFAIGDVNQHQANGSLDRAGHLRHRVAMEGDPLADVLTLASARCVRIGTLEAGGTWALNFPPPQKIIRFYLAAATTVTAGWLRALNDERIAPALRLMHGEPGRAWRLGDLAKHVGMSRTSFAMRFKTNAGVAPLTYLQNLRMRIAEQGLRDGKMSVAELAESLGYESDSAFSNAFKRRTGMAPKHYQSVLARMDQPTSDAAAPNPRHAS